MKNKFLKFGIILIVSGSVFFGSHLLYADEKGDLLQKGREAFEKNELDKAIKIYEKVVEIDSNFAPVYNELGLAHAALNTSLHETMWFFNVALEIDPQFKEVYFNKCRVYHTAEEYTQAEEACKEAVKLDPNYLQAKLQMAWIYLTGLSSPSQAIPLFNEVLKQVPNPMVYYGLGTAHARLGDTAQALDIVMTLKEMGSNDLAVGLEDIVRSTSHPVISSVPTNVDMPEKQKEGQEGEVQPSPSYPVSGEIMRIRLRGKLTNPNPR